MWSRTLKASRPMVNQAVKVQARAFTRPAALKADFVQDLYLKELKAYKPQPLKANDAEGHVLKFQVPKAPESPEEANLADASALKDYEAQTVEVEGQSANAEPFDDEAWLEDDGWDAELAEFEKKTPGFFPS